MLGGARRTTDLHEVVLLLLGTGMRIGEALALEWADVDLDTDVPCVRVAAPTPKWHVYREPGRVDPYAWHRWPQRTDDADLSGCSRFDDVDNH